MYIYIYTLHIYVSTGSRPTTHCKRLAPTPVTGHPDIHTPNISSHKNYQREHIQQ